MKKLGLLVVFMAIPFLGACSENNEQVPPIDDDPIITIPEKESKKVKIVDLPPEAKRYSEGRLFIGEKEVPLFNVKVNDSHSFAYPESTRVDSAVARVYIKGSITFTYKLNFEINAKTRILPSGYNIVANHNLENKEISFEIYSAGKYIIEPNGDPNKALHLFVYDLDAQGESDIDESKFDNIIYFGPGVHTKDNSKYIDSNKRITLENNTLVKFDDGAIVEGAFEAINKENITFIGKGIISGEHFSRTEQIVPLNFSYCKNIFLNDVYFLDPAAWTCNLYFCEDSSINNVNIISSRANGDGITLQSCKNITVDGAFVRGFDDNLVVKNYASPYGNSDRKTHGNSENITFKNSFLRTDLAQSMEIGYETTGEYIKDINFENIFVYHAFHKPIISIHNSNYAEVFDVTFKDITVEDCSLGLGDSSGNSEIIDIKAKYSSTFSDNPAGEPTEVGNVHDVKIENVLVKEIRNGYIPKFTFEGQLDTRIDFKNIVSKVSDVEIKNIQIEDEIIENDSSYINRASYSENIIFSSNTKKVEGAKLLYSRDNEKLDNFTDEIEFL